MSRRVLVTGVSHGIGRVVTHQLASDGFDASVYCCDGRVEADAIAADIQANKGNARVLQSDVRDRAVCRTQFDANVEAHGVYYNIVLCAGATCDTAFPALTDEDQDIVLETGLDEFCNVVYPLIISMVCARKGGHIIIIASVSGVMDNCGQVNHSVVKAGLIGATKALTAGLAPRKIAVNCVTPGLIETDILAHMEHVD